MAAAVATAVTATQAPAPASGPASPRTARSPAPRSLKLNLRANYVANVVSFAPSPGPSPSASRLGRFATAPRPADPAERFREGADMVVGRPRQCRIFGGQWGLGAGPTRTFSGPAEEVSRQFWLILTSFSISTSPDAAELARKTDHFFSLRILPSSTLVERGRRRPSARGRLRPQCSALGPFPLQFPRVAGSRVDIIKDAQSMSSRRSFLASHLARPPRPRP